MDFLQKNWQMQCLQPLCFALALMVYFIRKSNITLIQGTPKLAFTKIPVACWADLLNISEGNDIQENF